MKMFPRSFYFVSVLTAAILMTGCATQQQQQQAVQGAVVGAVIGGLIGAVSTNTRQQPQYQHQQPQHQQPQHQQQRAHPGCHSGARPYWIGPNQPGCMMQQGGGQQQQLHPSRQQIFQPAYDRNGNQIRNDAETNREWNCKVYGHCR